MENGPIYQNITIWCAFAGWLVAQSIKMFTSLIENRRLDFRYLMSTGGMPSAHTAMACSLAMSVGLRAGFTSPVFALSFGFAGVVMFDAQSVRRAAGAQARILNQIVDELFKEHHLSEHKLAELLGHTRIEVFFGMLTGIVTALLIHGWFG